MLRRSIVHALFAVLVLVATAATARAQFKSDAPTAGPKLDQEATTRVKIGVTIKAPSRVQGIVATALVPVEWPEQRVAIVNEDVSPSSASLSYRTLSGGGGAKLMVLEIPQLAAGAEARALVTLEVSRRALAAPTDTSVYKIPKKLDRTLTVNVGNSPFIESRHPKISSAAREAVATAETDWKKVEAIYDWARDHVAYKTGDVKGAARALYDKEGDVDDLTSLFVAMCRAQKIPARTVFVLGSCYAEFYLDDAEGKGHWFPCQVAGARAFGAIDSTKPILQKGDNFKNPENPKDRLRYVTEYFHATGRGKEPKVTFMKEIIGE